MCLYVGIGGLVWVEIWMLDISRLPGRIECDRSSHKRPDPLDDCCYCMSGRERLQKPIDILLGTSPFMRPHVAAQEP